LFADEGLLDNIYGNDSTLIERIEFAITNIDKIRDNSLEYISAKYDWKNIVKYYDTAFEEMIY